jgi:hypothetical protein
MYETYIWNYTPMHPSILHESSVRRILCGSEEDTGTPLALSVNVALAAGTPLLTIHTLAPLLRLAVINSLIH